MNLSLRLSLLSSLLLICCFLSHAHGDTPPLQQQKPEERRNVFSYSLAQERYNWYSDYGPRFLASGTHVAIGYGRYYPAGLILGQAHVVVGPFPFHEQESKGRFEYQGSGGSLQVAIPFRGGDLRRFTHNCGPLFGLEYMALLGKSVISSDEPRDLIAGFSLSGGIFYSWLQPPRLMGKTQEELATRLDGILTSFSVATPLSLSRSNQRQMGSTLRIAVHLLIGP